LNETSKAEARRRREGWYDRYLVGDGIDIGCGADPITATCKRFDVADGDAQLLEGVPDGSFDWVYSSHCLEHVRDARQALSNWWRVLRPGGYLLLAVPDEDLYEQRAWPSVFNGDHKTSWTLHKSQSWSPVSQNLLGLLLELPGHEIVSVRQIDHGYDRAALGGDELLDQTRGSAEAAIEAIVRKQTGPEELRSVLERVVVCPQCLRLELTVLGSQGGALCARCRGCGEVVWLR
jgi:SAM-dependent methyltransferase